MFMVHKPSQRYDRPRRTIAGHTDTIRTVAYIPGGQRLLTGSDDKTIRVWRVGDDGGQEGDPIPHAAAVRHLAVTRDGKKIVSCDKEGRMTVWDIGTHELLEEWECPGRTYAHLSISHDDRFVAYGTRTVFIRELEGRVRFQYEIDINAGDGVESLCFSPGGDKLACGLFRAIVIYDVEGRRRFDTLTGHTGWVTSLQWLLASDGTRLYSGSDDKTIRCWDVYRGQQIEPSPLTGHTDWICSLSLSPDGTKLASVSRDKTVRLWDARSGRPIGNLLQHSKEVFAVAFSPLNDSVASAGADRKVSLWGASWWRDNQLNAIATQAPSRISSTHTHTPARRFSFDVENDSTTHSSLQVTGPGSNRVIRSAHRPQPVDGQPQTANNAYTTSESITDDLPTLQNVCSDHDDRPHAPTTNEGIMPRATLAAEVGSSQMSESPDTTQRYSSRVPFSTTQIAQLSTKLIPPSQRAVNQSSSDPLDLTPYISKLDDQYLAGGSFGDVYKCQYHSPTGALEVAVKAFRFHFTLQEGSEITHAVKMVRRELGIWRRLDHPNIVPFLGIATGFGMQGSLALVSTWMPNGSLHDFLEKHGERIHVPHQLQFLRDIANGLNYLHSFHANPIVHGDLNGSNVLVDGDFTVRLVDFGYSSVVGHIPEALKYLQRSTARPGAIRWSAPELILPQAEGKTPERTPKSDIYSFGCLALQVFSGRQPWSEVGGEAAIPVYIFKGLQPKRPESRAIDDRHWGLIQKCWTSPEKRPTAATLVSRLQELVRICPRSTLLRDLLSSGS